MPPADDREASVEPNVVRELNCHAAKTLSTRVHRHGARLIFAEGGRDILGPIGCDAPSRMAFEKVAAAVGTGAKRWAGWLEGGGERAAAGDDAASRARVSAALTEFAEANFGAECRELHGDFFGAAT